MYSHGGVNDMLVWRETLDRERKAKSQWTKSTGAKFGVENPYAELEERMKSAKLRMTATNVDNSLPDHHQKPKSVPAPPREYAAAPERNVPQSFIAKELSRTNNNLGGTVKIFGCSNVDYETSYQRDCRSGLKR
mmetsp:Transcript_7264/g.11522  ORF Transcript_7264/g.11522 Transcript_7264/m.11522 type:complete len:134 (+) Transcript_7264:155-556(+)|eukprot:CAMPEP_0184671312 /NCGR_PEP_ID=MMETSP0308-20130426/85399_1 /TAXON_ID=38269 /ORGANISM="Gloeochaete witrockiana, Strain SAG 46.84" /LENGTH=133 /DNA_ID=CAMNT_0027118405 /DNA_START=147 /DNA_END=548 /DNA_ORIENTATION=-